MPRSLPRLTFILVNFLFLCLDSAVSAPRPNLSLPTRSRQVCPIVLPTASPSAAPPSAAPGADNSLFTPEPRVIGGSRALPSIQSFLVSLSHPNDSFACTGSVISARWVLTAAHCLVRRDWKLRVGSERPDSVQPIPIRRVIPHSSYIHGRIDSPGDIALIELDDAIPTGATFVNLNEEPANPQPGSFARTAGYGRVVEGVPPGNPFANQVDMPVNSPERCRKIYSGYLDIRASDFICVGYDKSRCRADSCHGDSGGPVLQYNARGQPVQVGVVSFGFKCGMQGIPSVGVRISAFTGWIGAQGATFYRGRDIVAQFADGSDDAAQNDTDLSVFQSDDPARDDPRFVVIPKATFIIICLIAAIAVIALVILSVSFLRSARSVARSEAGANGPDGRSDGRAEEGRVTSAAKVEEESSDEDADEAAVGSSGGGARASMPLAYSLFRVPSSMIIEEDDSSSSSLVTAPTSLQTNSGKGTNWASLATSLPRDYQVQLESGAPLVQVTFPGAPSPPKETSPASGQRGSGDGESGSTDGG